MTYRVDQSSITPPSRQIVEAILDGIAAGALAPGDKLLSVRALAAEALVNPNTAARAYRDLELMGVLEGRNGRGVYVTPKGPKVAREIRVAATLEAYQRSAAEALRAGHANEALRAVLDGLIQELSS
jgi:DNA-binding transcriptional regulator YhcF (GntR family)